ncbi:uncharacterized protein LOC123556048 [Mercenaria mercenaria]|uniref:uncharacterized protein LOC123556048 n=1 Tax=Mercenaria mercenaria TaxID=6596 RepID=UPI00234EDF48|nr:uncharacterized protein LOC123556048 [Mercenaria mercenaria]
MALVPFLGVPEVLKVAKPVQLEGGKGCVLYYRYLIREDKQHDCCAGLRHVTEIQKAGRGLYGYFCDLCKFTCQAPSVIHQHVCGYQHVINYLEQDHPYIYGKVLLESEEQVKKKMTDFHVRELRQTEGLEAINVVMVRLKDKQQGDNIKSETVAREKKQSKLPQNLDKHRASLPSSESSEKPKGYQKHAEATRGDQKPAQKYEKSSQVLKKPSQMQQKAQVHQPSSKEFGKASETIQKPHKSQTSSKALRKPSQMQQKPSQEHQKSSQIHQKSSQIHQNQKTSQMQQKPSQVHQEQSQVQQKPSQGQEKPSQVHQKPSQVQQKSSQVCQKQSQVQQKPSQVQQKPSQAQQKSSQICQKLSQVRQKPEVGKKPEQQQKDVLIHKNGPVSASHVRWKPELDNINIYKLLKIECGEKPVIGLQYIHETIDKSSEDPISYQCKLCCLTFTIATICKHLTSFVHRFKYLEKNYTELCEQIKRAPQLLENYCCWIDATYGREDCVLRKVLIKDGKDGRPVYIEMKSVTDLEYTSPWKDVYSLEKLKQMSQTVQSKPQKPTAAEERIKEQVKDIMKDIEDKTADINKISHGCREGQNKMMTDAESTGVAASVAERAGETYIWKKEYEKLRERISNQEIVKCQRRSKFLSTYGDKAGKIPLTGLKEITEFQLPDVNAQPWYLCFLCEKRLCSMKIFDHVTSHDHRLQYMKSNYQYLYDLVTSNNPAAMSVDGFAKEIASTEGDVREMEVMLELNSEVQNRTMEVRDKTSSSNQEVVRNKCDRKRLGSSDVSTKTVRPVLKDSDMQNSENNRFKENLSLEKGNNEKDCNVKRMRAVSSPGGSCNRDKQRKTHRSGPVKNSGSNDPLEKSCDPTESACQRNDKYVKRQSDDKFSAGKEGVPRSAENVQLKRTLESDSGSQENVEKQRTDSPRKKRMRSQAVSAVDSNLQKSSDKMTDINQYKKVRDSVKEEKKHNTLQQLIDEWPHTSMIGLDYICEIKHSVREDFPPLYRCDICGNTDSKHLAAREMLFHVCSRNHRESFFKNIRKDLFMEIQSNTTDQISYNSLLDQYAKLYQDRTSECFHTESVDDDLLWQRFQTQDKKVNPSTISSTVVQMKAGSPAVKISYYVSPSEIHLQLTDTDKTAVNELMKDMQVVYNNSVHDSHVKWEEGMFCAAFLMSEKLWYRGKITEIATPGQGFEVLLIDYGSKHRVSDHNLRCVLKQFRGLPCLSFCSKLCDLKPANSLVEWPSSTNTLVKNVVQRRKLFLEKKGRVKDGKLPVDLLIESEDKLSGTKKYRSLSLILQREGVAVKEGLDNLSADSNFSSGMPVKTEVKSGPVCENESTSVRETEERENFTTLYSHDSTTGDFLNQGNLSGNIDPPNAESRFPVTLGVQSQVCFEYNHGFTDYNSPLEPIESSAMDSCFGLKDNSSYRSDIFSTEHLQEPFEVHPEQCMSEDLVPHINSDLDYPAFMHDPFQPNERVEASRFFGNDQSHYYDGTRVMQASTDYEDSMEIDYPQKSQQMVRDPPYLKCSFSAVHPVQAVQQDLVVGQEFCGTTELSFSSLKSLDSFDFGAAHVGSGLHLPKTRQDKRKRMRRRGKHDKKHFRPSEEHLGPSKEHFRSLNRYFGPSISNNKKLKRRRNRNKQNQSNKVAGGLLHDGTSTNDKPVEKDESGKSTKEIGSKEKASGILTSVWERLNASDEEDINLSESELQELEATLNSSNQFGSDASDQE